MLEPLRNRTYRQLFAAQVIALIGTGLLTVALGLLAYELAGGDAGAVLGTALAIKMIAYVGVSPIAGAAAGMLPRRAMLVALDLVRAAIALCLPFVDQVWQIYVLIFILQSASAALRRPSRRPFRIFCRRRGTTPKPCRFPGSLMIWKHCSALRLPLLC